MSLLRVAYSPRNPPLRQRNLFPNLQVFDLPLQFFPLSLRNQILPRDRFQLVIRQFAHKPWRKHLDRRLRTGYKEVIRGLHTDNVHETLSGDLVVRVEDVVKIVHCVFEIAAGCDALIEDCVEFDNFALVGVSYTFQSQNCCLPG